MAKPTGKIIDFEYDTTFYDASNPLVLTANASTNKKSKAIKREAAPVTKLLSKKKRKELERKLAQKEKKLTRADLWKELESYNKPPANASPVSVLPLFKRTRKQPKALRVDNSTKGKSWRNEPADLSEDSPDTDDFSSEESVDTTVEHIEVETVVPNLPVLPPAPEMPPKKSVEISVDAKPARFVLVNRNPEVVAARLALPIISEEATIMEAISQHDCVIICGATGCGKTTQLPQFLYEAGYSKDGYMIGVTEPRRVAAISMSRRVGKELNLPTSKVSYHIRYENTVAKDTEIKFMTDGVLLQEIKQDFELSRYSSIIIDEAHERTIYTDVLLGLLSMVLRLRRRRYVEGRPTRGTLLPPLKLVIMSATLRVTDFSENRRLFPETLAGPPPVIHVESRQYPVTCHFARITQTDYLKAAFRKVIQLHQTAAPGGILVFLTGQREVLTLCSWLSRAFPPKPDTTDSAHVAKRNIPRKSTIRVNAESRVGSESSAAVDYSLATINLDNFDIIPADEEVEIGPSRSSTVASKKVHPSSTETTLNDLPENDDLDEANDDDDVLDVIASTQTEVLPPIHALPLYSLLPPERQQLVFEPPPENHRLVVVATNVAETSLTIPNIRFVVDSGKAKTKVYDPATGASSFEIVWISQASAEQRAGRAGRVAPGQCHRLYSSQVYTNMQPHASPDILTRPIDEVVLMLKSYLGSTPLARFPLPTAPSASAIEFAERRLVCLGALEEPHDGQTTGASMSTITRAGHWMSRLPLPARFARMLLFANQHDLMPYAVILVSALSVPELFVNSPASQKTSDDTDEKRDPAMLTPEERFRTNFAKQFVKKQEDLYLGDLSVLLGTVCCLERYGAQLTGLVPPENGVLEACGGANRVHRDPDGALRFLAERCGVRWNAYKEVRQLRRQLTNILNANVPDLNLPLDVIIPKPSSTQVNQLRQLFLVGSPCHVATKFNVPVEGLPAKERRRLRYAYKVPGVAGPVFIDPNSPLVHENCPYIAFLELHSESRPFLRTVCAVDSKWIPFLAPNNYRVDGVVLNDEQRPVIDASTTKTDTDASASLLPILPTPTYDMEQDVIVTGAKSVSYVGTCASRSDGDAGEFELPCNTVVFPLSGLAASRSIGAEEALMWSVRWFARLLLEGVIIKELEQWFPNQVKKNLSPTLMTVSWGLVRSEVRKLVSILTTNRIDTRRSLFGKWKTDPLFLSRELASWLKPSVVTDFHSKWSSFTSVESVEK